MVLVTLPFPLCLAVLCYAVLCSAKVHWPAPKEPPPKRYAIHGGKLLVEQEPGFVVDGFLFCNVKTKQLFQTGQKIYRLDEAWKDRETLAIVSSRGVFGAGAGTATATATAAGSSGFTLFMEGTWGKCVCVCFASEGHGAACVYFFHLVVLGKVV